MSNTITAESDARKVRLMKIEDTGSDNNYNYWASCTRDRLEQLKLWKYIDGPQSEPPIIPALVEEYEVQAINAADNSVITARVPGNEVVRNIALKAAEPWRDGDLAARTLLKEAIPAHKASALGLAQTAKEIWMALKEEYNPVNETRAAALHQKILAYVCTEELDVQMWLDNVRNMYYLLVRQAPDRMTDTDFASTIANLLPTSDEWRSFNTLLSNDMAKARRSGTPMRSSDVIQRIKEEDWSHRRGDADLIPQIHTLEAMARRKRPAAEANLGRAENKKVDKWCANTYCRSRKGHTKEECLAYGGGSCGQYPDWWTFRKDIHLPPDQRQKAKNHQRRTNPQANVVEANNAETVPTDEGITAAAALTQDNNYYVLNSFVEVSDPNQHITCNTIAFHASTTDTLKVFHDSGANRHIFFDRAHFDNYRTISPLTINGFGSSLSSAAIGVGDIFLHAKCNGNTSTIKLSEVLHVPSARLNLVSQGCLERRGVSLRSKDGRMTLTKNRADILTGNLQRNNLFLLDATPISRTLSDRILPSVSLADRIAPLPKDNRRKVSPDFYTAY